MPKVIIGIHGLGNKPDKTTLTHWWSLAMKEGLKAIGDNTELPHFELIYWADILNEKPLDKSIKDKSDLYFLEDKYIPAPIDYKPEANPIRQKVLGILERNMDKVLLNEDFSINYSFIAESIINKYFYELKVYFSDEKTDPTGKLVYARNLIKKRVVDVLKKYEDYEIFLVTHSMGSVIAFDVLSFIIPDFRINTFITMGSPLGLPVIISKIASCEQFRLRKEKIMSAPPGIYKNWFNFSDPDDQVAFDPTLNDDYGSNENGIRAIDYLVHNNYVIGGERNPHKSFGYLRTAQFANVLNDFIQEEEKVSLYEWLKAFFKKAS